jgi:hypothetical protein
VIYKRCVEERTDGKRAGGEILTKGFFEKLGMESIEQCGFGPLVYWRDRVRGNGSVERFLETRGSQSQHGSELQLYALTS